jgi:hypothetical protein
MPAAVDFAFERKPKLPTEDSGSDVIMFERLSPEVLALRGSR